MTIPVHPQTAFFKQITGNLANMLQVQKDQYQTPLLSTFMDKAVEFPAGPYQKIDFDPITQVGGRLTVNHMDKLSTAVPKVTTETFQVGVGMIAGEDTFNDFNTAQLNTLRSDGARYPLDPKHGPNNIATQLNGFMINAFYSGLSTDTVGGEPTGVFGLKELIPTSNTGTKYGISLTSKAYLRNSIYNTNTEEGANVDTSNAVKFFENATKAQMRKRGRLARLSRTDYTWFVCPRFFDMLKYNNRSLITHNTLENSKGLDINTDTAYVEGVRVIEDKYLPNLTAYLVPTNVEDYCSCYFGIASSMFDASKIKNGNAQITSMPYIELDAEIAGSDGQRAKQKIFSKGWMETIKLGHVSDYLWNVKYTTAIQFMTKNAEAFMVLTSNA